MVGSILVPKPSSTPKTHLKIINKTVIQASIIDPALRAHQAVRKADLKNKNFKSKN